MRISVVVFPGTNCEHDIQHVYGSVLKQKVSLVWHRDRDLQRPDMVVVPGGFAHGDYLRTGALAKLSPIMTEVGAFAERGGPVLGICNGFQILCEAGLLPGVLLQNVQRRFLSRFVHMRVERSDTAFTRGLASGTVVTCPIAHFEGNYFAPDETVRELEGEGRVVFRYCDPNGVVDGASLEWNPNGAMNAIAGITNARRNVVGLMPHPERAVEALVGGLGRDSGRAMFAGSIG